MTSELELYIRALRDLDRQGYLTIDGLHWHWDFSLDRVDLEFTLGVFGLAEKLGLCPHESWIYQAQLLAAQFAIPLEPLIEILVWAGNPNEHPAEGVTVGQIADLLESAVTGDIAKPKGA